jgi:hypothetical protein
VVLNVHQKFNYQNFIDKQTFTAFLTHPQIFLSFPQLKASRLLLPKPYFYPTNLQAPYTSWILMSQNYENFRDELEVYGLVIITQMRGSLRITLQINQSCTKFCKDLSVKLFSGESLIFIANMWKPTYEFLADDPYSVTMVTETNLN